jgi:hypothetical protein
MMLLRGMLHKVSARIDSLIWYRMTLGGADISYGGHVPDRNLLPGVQVFQQNEALAKAFKLPFL